MDSQEEARAGQVAVDCEAHLEEAVDTADGKLEAGLDAARYRLLLVCGPGLLAALALADACLAALARATDALSAHACCCLPRHAALPALRAVLFVCLTEGKICQL